MKARLRRTSIVPPLSSLMIATLALTAGGCADSPPPAEVLEARGPEVTPVPLHSERGGLGLMPRKRDRVGAQAGMGVDARRSLAVTDKVIVSRFSLRAVMNQLAAQHNARPDSVPLTGETLFRQLWDTQNPSPGALGPGVPHCSDKAGTLNGFPYPCRPASSAGEGAQAFSSSLTTIDDYIAIGLFNRFDLAAADGSDCGEHRIVFAKVPNGPRSRNFIIFEAVLPNPRPDLGLQGCWPVADFWADLTAEPSLTVQADRLVDFYFNGLSYLYADDTASTPTHFRPVIHTDNLGLNPGNMGQIRTNQFMMSPWLLREFKLQRPCPTLGACELQAVPQTVKTNPAGTLFDPSNLSPLAADFRNHFLTQVASLSLNDINGFNYEVPDRFNIGQSDSQTTGAPDDYVARFGTGPSLFRNNIQAELDAIGSSLTPTDIVARAQALSCGGCHQRSNGDSMGGGLTWPASAVFVHNSEADDPANPSRFDISDALEFTFLPKRKQVLEDFLSSTSAP